MSGYLVGLPPVAELAALGLINVSYVTMGDCFMVRLAKEGQRLRSEIIN
jgi:hypothetical protein